MLEWDWVGREDSLSRFLSGMDLEDFSETPRETMRHRLAAWRDVELSEVTEVEVTEALARLFR